ELGEALEMARQSVKRDPGSASWQYLLGSIALDHAERGITRLERRSEFILAVRMLESVVKKMPQHPDAYIRLGRAYEGLDVRDRARASFEEAVQINPSSGEALARLAHAALEDGDTAAGVAAAES